MRVVMILGLQVWAEVGDSIVHLLVRYKAEKGRIGLYLIAALIQWVRKLLLLLFLLDVA
jgi:hypothetical protein